MTRAFVAGATGLTGRAVVGALRRRGLDVIAHVRPDSSRLDEWRERFAAEGAAVDATPWTLEAMTATFRERQPTQVFALLGTTRKRGGDYEGVDYGLTVLLMDAAVAAGIRPRFVYLSAAGVSKHARGAYMSVRWRAEEKLRQSGLPFTIARPSFILGHRDEARPAETVGARASDGLLSVAGLLGARRFAARYRSTTNETLAEALVRLGTDESWENRIADGDDLRG